MGLFCWDGGLSSEGFLKFLHLTFGDYRKVPKVTNPRIFFPIVIILTTILNWYFTTRKAIAFTNLGLLFRKKSSHQLQLFKGYLEGGGGGGGGVGSGGNFFFQTLSCAINFFLEACVYIIFFSEVACVSPSLFRPSQYKYQVVPCRKFFFGSGRVYEFFCFCTSDVLAGYFFQNHPIPPPPLPTSEVKWSAPNGFRSRK